MAIEILYIFGYVFLELNTYHNLDDWLSWMDELSCKDFVIADNFLDQQLFDAIRFFFLSHLDAFSKAGIGALDNNVIQHDIRSDFTYWLIIRKEVITRNTSISSTIETIG